MNEQPGLVQQQGAGAERDRDRRYRGAQAAHEALLATSAIDPRVDVVASMIDDLLAEK